jgi:two-component SAPR family response regulator
MQQALPLVPEGCTLEITEMIDGVTAYAALRDGRADGPALLAALWRRLRERQYYDCFEGCPEFAALLCVLALQHGIEPEFVLSTIDKQGLVPPADAPEHWPWPLRIRALGGFAVQRHGQPLASEGKAQKKPLALLQAVVAHGAWRDGQGVDVNTLVDELWPDVEASDPKSSFEVTLSRLRKWLGVDGALRISDGRLSLNDRLVWCDRADFEATFQVLQQHLVPHADAAPLAALGRRLVGLYRGKLFGTSTLEPWAAVARERAALQFTRAVTDYGHHLETQKAWPEALRLYEAGLTQDILAESIYRALMRCHLALGQPAEAQRVFQRCQDMLAAALKLRPSAATLQLAARIASDPDN